MILSNKLNNRIYNIVYYKARGCYQVVRANYAIQRNSYLINVERKFCAIFQLYLSVLIDFRNCVAQLIL